MRCLLSILLIMTNLQAFAAPKDEALKLWQKRDDKASLEAAITKWNEQLKTTPEDLETLVYLTRANYVLGDGHLSDKDEKKAAFQKAREIGEQALSTNLEYKKKKDIQVLTQREAEALYWTAVSLGKWAKLNGIMSSLGYKNDILGMIDRVEKLTSRSAFHAAVPRYYGGFYALAPGIAGGSMEKSKKNFEEALTLAPEILSTKVLYAEVYWTKEDNEKEFEKLLNEVLASQDGPADIAADNRIQKKKAKDLLAQKKDLF